MERILPFRDTVNRNEDDVRITRHGKADDDALSAAGAGTGRPHKGDRGAEFGVAFPATQRKGSLLVVGLLHGWILRETRARKPRGWDRAVGCWGRTVSVGWKYSM